MKLPVLSASQGLVIIYPASLYKQYYRNQEDYKAFIFASPDVSINLWNWREAARNFYDTGTTSEHILLAQLIFIHPDMRTPIIKKLKKWKENALANESSLKKLNQTYLKAIDQIEKMIADYEATQSEIPYKRRNNNMVFSADLKIPETSWQRVPQKQEVDFDKYLLVERDGDQLTFSKVGDFVVLDIMGLSNGTISDKEKLAISEQVARLDQSTLALLNEEPEIKKALLQADVLGL